MRLGLSSHAFAWAIGVTGYPPPDNPLTALQLVQRAVESGVGVVQIADNLPLHVLDSAALNTLSRTAEKSEVAIEVGTCGIEPAQLRTYLSIAGKLRSPILRTLIDTHQAEPALEVIIASLRGVLPEFEKAGVCLAIENHDRFPALILSQILQDLGSPSVGICLDTANSLGCGEGLETVLDRLAPWVVNLHVKDFQASRLNHQKGFIVQGRPAGQGQLDIPWLLSKIRSHGRDPNAIIETWVSPESTIEETITKEASWAVDSIRAMRQWIST